MKTLNEVIVALEVCTSGYCSHPKHGDCPYLDERNDCDTRQRKLDALHYLKHLQEYYNMSREHHEPNPALSWDELKQMFHRPVWIETTAKKGWNIIVSIDSADMQVIHTAHRGPKLSGFSKADLGKTWQAYRKERS